MFVRRLAKREVGEVGLEHVAQTFREFEELKATVRGNALGLDALAMLLWLRDNPRSSASRVAELMFFSRPKTSRCLNRLLSYGLVQEQLDPNDLRKSSFSLSSRGDNVAFEIARALGARNVEHILQEHRRFCKASQTAAVEVGAKVSDQQLRVVMVLGEAGKPLAVTEIARAAAIAQPSATMAIQALQDMGLAARSTSEHDGRMSLIALSSRGKRLFKKVHEA